MPPLFRDDPYPNYNFQVIITGVSDDGMAVRGSFAEVSGLDVVIDPIEYRTGSEDITVRKIPGLKKFTNIILKRGIIGDLAFWNWLVEGMNGLVRRADGYIILLDENRNEVMRWNFTRWLALQMDWAEFERQEQQNRYRDSGDLPRGSLHRRAVRITSY